MTPKVTLVDVSDFFFCSGRGNWGKSQEGGGEGGAEGPGGCLRRIGEFLGGKGAKYFCFRAETPTKFLT